MIQGIDVSKWQGVIDWPAVKNAGIDFAIVKISGGDVGLYFDATATRNYNGAKAAGLVVGGYHFAGGGSPIEEANKFLAGMAPYSENDIFVLDWEIPGFADPVSWCAQFAQRVHDVAGVWPLLYINGSTANAYNWNGNSVIANCGKWIAWYDRDPAQQLPVNMFYTMHQYTSTGRVNGVAGNVDRNAFYGDVSQLKRYGWHAPQPEKPAPVISTGTATETQSVPFAKVEKESDQLDDGVKQLSQNGQDGVRTLTYTVTYSDGQEVSRVLSGDEVTIQPIEEVTLVGTKKPTPTPEPGTDPVVQDPKDDPTNNPLFAFFEAIVNFLSSVVAKLKKK